MVKSSKIIFSSMHSLIEASIWQLNYVTHQSNMRARQGTILVHYERLVAWNKQNFNTAKFVQ